MLWFPVTGGGTVGIQSLIWSSGGKKRKKKKEMWVFFNLL